MTSSPPTVDELIKTLEEKDRFITHLQQQNKHLSEQLAHYKQQHEAANNQQPSFTQLFMEEQNSDLWWNVVKYLNGLDLVSLTRSHSALLKFYLKYRLYLWKDLVNNQFKLGRLNYQSSSGSNSSDDTHEFIYWKTLYMKLYDFHYREDWRANKIKQQMIQHDSLSILFIEYNPVVVTRCLPKFNSILDCLDDQQQQQNSPTVDESSSIFNIFKKKRLGTKLELLTNEEKKIRDILINSKHYALISTMHSPIFHIFNLDNARIERSFRGHQGTVNDVDVMCTDPFWIGRHQENAAIGMGTLLHNTSSTSFNNRVISSSSDGTLKIWNMQTAACLITLKDGHEGSVYSVRCTSDHSKAISSGHDGTIALWDLVQVCHNHYCLNYY
jgi:WD40 repeat protein